jgi:demethylmenaquinone methyltransferase/2-methoxy-6-polyprenyl-1,4-benzoquinol methylase
MGAVMKEVWTTEGEQKRAAVQRMFADIAPTYDLLNGLISFRLHHRWRAFAVRQLRLQQGESALDVCCGTGDFMLPLKRAVGAHGAVVGVDFCAPMLEIAKKKTKEARLSLGDACRLPVRDEVFNAVSVGWGIRNVPDIDAAHAELARVLKPGGRFVSLDMARPNNRLIRAVSEWTFNSMVPRLGSLFGKKEAYTYLPKSTRRFSSRDELKASMERAGFIEVAFKDLLFGNVCVHWGRKS